MRHARYAFLIAAALLAGCGTDIDDIIPPGGSCVIASSSTCQDFTGSGWRTPGAASRTCSSNGGVYSSGACTSTNRIGTCRLRPGGAEEVSVRFYSPTYNATTARVGCTAAASMGGVSSSFSSP